jgi:hypothetical protein
MEAGHKLKPAVVSAPPRTLAPVRRRALGILRTLGLVVALAYTLVLANNTLLAWFDYGSHGVMRTDFALYYAFSRIGLTQGWTSLYDLAAQRRLYATMPGRWWFALPYTGELSIVVDRPA